MELKETKSGRGKPSLRFAQRQRLASHDGMGAILAKRANRPQDLPDPEAIAASRHTARPSRRTPIFSDRGCQESRKLALISIRRARRDHRFRKARRPGAARPRPCPLAGSKAGASRRAATRSLALGRQCRRATRAPLVRSEGPKKRPRFGGARTHAFLASRQDLWRGGHLPRCGSRIAPSVAMRIPHSSMKCKTRPADGQRKGPAVVAGPV